jgi:HNH endonuclease
MPTCIFCLQEKERLTEEHVFPAALGGALVVENSVCVGCNNGFSKFEQPLIEEFTPLRLLLKIPDRYGKVPAAAATVKTADKEYEARVRDDGSIQMKPVVTEIVLENGKREFLHQFATERQKEKLRQEASRKGFQIIESEPGDPEEGEVHVGGELEIIGSSAGLRTVSKIAFMGLAHFAGVNLALRDSFNEIRSHVLNGTGPSPARLFIHEGFLKAVQQGPHQHSIIVAARHDRARVDAIVSLFGGLCYFVVLSDHYAGADFFNTLAYDAFRGEINGVLQSHVDAELLETDDVLNSADTVWSDLAASGQRFCNYLDAEVKAYFKRARAARNRAEA